MAFFSFKNSQPSFFLLMYAGTLNFGNNGFTGTVPKELYALTNLTTLDLSNTKLYEEISTAIGAMSQLVYFRAANTGIRGTLPTQLFSLAELRTLDLSSGKLTGSLSESFSKLTNLDVAILHNNGFTGTIPAGFGRLPFLGKCGDNWKSVKVGCSIFSHKYISFYYFRKIGTAFERPYWLCI